jgi:hypothetical protein
VVVTTATNKNFTYSGGNFGISSSTPSSRLTVSGSTFLGGNVIATGTLAVTSTTTTGGLSVGSLDGLLWGTNGNVSSVATSSLGLQPTLTGGQVGAMAYWTGTGTLAATTSPVVGSITATSTTSTSTFAGGINVAGANGFSVAQNGSVAVGRSTAGATVDISGNNSINTPAIRVTNGNVDLPVAVRQSAPMVYNDLLIYFPFNSSITSSRQDYTYYTRTDTTNGSTATYTMDSGYLTSDYVYNNIPRLEKSVMGHGVWMENARRNMLGYLSLEDAVTTGWGNVGLETFAVPPEALVSPAVNVYEPCLR